jgi:hypothetical protein
MWDRTFFDHLNIREDSKPWSLNITLDYFATKTPEVTREYEPHNRKQDVVIIFCLKLLHNR